MKLTSEASKKLPKVIIDNGQVWILPPKKPSRPKNSPKTIQQFEEETT